MNSEFVGSIADKSEIGNLAGLQLKLQFISDKGDELGIRGFSENVVIPTKAEPRGGIFALYFC